jgi:hypothetical protein
MNDAWELLKNIPIYQQILRNIEAQKCGTPGVSGWSIILQPFTYTALCPEANLGAGVTGFPVNINIQADSDFIILSQAYWAYHGNAQWTPGTRIVPNVTTQKTDTGSSKQFSDVPVPIWTEYGDGEFPYVLPQPLYLAANSQLQIVFNNLDGANANTIYLEHQGVKIYVTEGVGNA